MNRNQGIALGIGLLVFISVIMPGLTRYMIVLLLLLVIADFTIARMTYGAVTLLPFRLL